MKYVHNLQMGPFEASAGTDLVTVARFGVSTLDLLTLHVDNLGTGSLTKFEVWARGTHAAGFVRLLAGDYTGFDIYRRGATADITTLAPNSSALASLAVSGFVDIECRVAAAAQTTVRLSAGGFQNEG